MTAVLNADHRWFLMPSTSAAPSLLIQAPGPVTTSLLSLAQLPTPSTIACAALIAPSTTALTGSTEEDQFHGDKAPHASAA
jgi:hypothetical protein